MGRPQASWRSLWTVVGGSGLVGIAYEVNFPVYSPSSSNAGPSLSDESVHPEGPSCQVGSSGSSSGSGVIESEVRGMGGISTVFISTSLHGLEAGSSGGSSGGGGVFSCGRMGDVPLDCFGSDLALLLLGGPRSKRGSSVGEGGGIGALRSMSGGSSLICNFCFPVFLVCRGFFFCTGEG